MREYWLNFKFLIDTELMKSQNIVYTSYYQPSVITQNNFELTYSYAGDDERIKSVLKQNGTIINTSYYFGDYEKDNTAGTTRHLHYVSNGSSIIAIVERIGTTDTYHYTYTDYLGSILTVTSSAGAIEHEQNFDAWGRSRNATSWAYTSIPTPPVWLYRGYTGHEHIPQMGIINMNGRLYDPVLARMLSPDNHVQMPDYMQNYNRYSYALNNPLKYTDPDGEAIVVPILIGAAIGVLTNGVENWVNHRPFFRGGFRAAVMGGISGAVSYGIGQVVGNFVAEKAVSKLGGEVVRGMMHGMAGEVFSLYNGGKPGAGFLSGALSSAVGSLTGGPISKMSKPLRGVSSIVIGGLTGGIGARIAGGKFTDGFRQGAITSGLNHGIHAGYFGKNIAMASITGRLRHVTGPEARGYFWNFSGVAVAGLQVQPEAINILRGTEKGTWLAGGSLAAAAGFDVSTAVGSTQYYYRGNKNEINSTTFNGFYQGINLAVSFGVDFGFSASIAYSSLKSFKPFTIPISGSLGFGVPVPGTIFCGSAVPLGYSHFYKIW